MEIGSGDQELKATGLDHFRFSKSLRDDKVETMSMSISYKSYYRTLMCLKKKM